MKTIKDLTKEDWRLVLAENMRFDAVGGDRASNWYVGDVF